MNIAEIIYQHVKAIEVLHVVEFLETKPNFIVNNAAENDALVYALYGLNEEEIRFVEGK